MLTYLNKITHCIVHLLNKYIYYIHTRTRVIQQILSKSFARFSLNMYKSNKTRRFNHA